MRLIAILLTLILLSLPGSASPSSTEPQIVDPPYDVRPNGIGVIDVPEPSIDLLSVTFGRHADNLTVTFHVVNVTYVLPSQTVEGKVYAVFFSNANHSDIEIDVHYIGGYGWGASLGCIDGGAFDCSADLPAYIDTAANTVGTEVPLSIYGSNVHAPTASTDVKYDHIPDAWPTLSFQDDAPNCTLICYGGSDYNP